MSAQTELGEAVASFVALLDEGCEEEAVLQGALDTVIGVFEKQRETMVNAAAFQQQHPNRMPIDGPTSIEPLDSSSASGTNDTAEDLSFVLDRPTSCSMHRSENGHTLLEIAVERQNNAAVEQLLLHKADPDKIVGLPCTCLCRICYSFPHNTSMMSVLLRHGASPDATTNNDEASASCLIISVVKDNLEAVRLLVDAGADMAYEWKGSNAFAMAVDFKKKEIATVFEQRDFQIAKANRKKNFDDRRVLETQREKEKEDKLRREREGRNRRPRRATGTGGGGGAEAVAQVEGGGASGGVSSSSPERTPPPEERHDDEQQQEERQDEGTSTGSGNTVNILNLEDTHPPAPVSHHRQKEVAALIAAELEAQKNFTETMERMDWVVPLEEMELGSLISAGAHGDVYRASLKSTGDIVAFKKFPCLDLRGRETFRREVAMLSRFRHENIVLFRGAVIDPSMCGLLSELCSTNLFDRLHSSELPSPTWKQRTLWARDIARAMTYLHTRSPPVVHRDLKSMNVLLDGQQMVKICDFGMARIREHTYISTQHIAGSPAWMAPEVLRGDDFNGQSDVYSFGVVLWEIVTGKVPWPDKNMAQLVGLIGFSGAQLPLPAVEKLPQGCPPALFTIIESCWAPAPDRPPFRTIRTLLENIITGLNDGERSPAISEHRQ